MKTAATTGNAAPAERTPPAAPGTSLRKFVKSIKTRVTRQRAVYQFLFRMRASYHAVCEPISAVASRVSGRAVRVGVDLLSEREPTGGTKYGLAACLRFKNEARYLREWIEFHRRVGFEHFYLYDNNSTDDFQDVLRPFIDEGIVTLHDWPTVPASPAADIHCISNYRRQAAWIAFLDADEFLFAPDGSDLRTVLAGFLDAPAVAVNWVYFGSSGHERRPEGGVVENYLLRAAKPNRHVKSIVNPRQVIKYGNSHHWFYSGGRLAANETGQPVYGSFHEPASAGRLRINHYYSKSAEEFLAKASMKSWVDREGARFPSRTANALREAIAANNEVEDTLARDLARNPGVTTRQS